MPSRRVRPARIDPPPPSRPAPNHPTPPESRTGRQSCRCRRSRTPGAWPRPHRHCQGRRSCPPDGWSGCHRPAPPPPAHRQWCRPPGCRPDTLRPARPGCARRRAWAPPSPVPSRPPPGREWHSSIPTMDRPPCHRARRAPPDPAAARAAPAGCHRPRCTSRTTSADARDSGGCARPPAPAPDARQPAARRAPPAAQPATAAAPPPRGHPADRSAGCSPSAPRRRLPARPPEWPRPPARCPDPVPGSNAAAA